ncbi:MAG: hypothetical protein HGA86_08565, partial [Anaerolineaceae bacterium]|nr:hypothetical protein [Anaerolineaceae bacterium]
MYNRTGAICQSVSLRNCSTIALRRKRRPQARPVMAYAWPVAGAHRRKVLNNGSRIIGGDRGRQDLRYAVPGRRWARQNRADDLITGRALLLRLLDLERQRLLEIDLDRKVVSPGGSIIYDADLMTRLKGASCLVFLDDAFIIPASIKEIGVTFLQANQWLAAVLTMNRLEIVVKKESEIQVSQHIPDTVLKESNASVFYLLGLLSYFYVSCDASKKRAL